MDLSMDTVTRRAADKAIKFFGDLDISRYSMTVDAASTEVYGTDMTTAVVKVTYDPDKKDTSTSYVTGGRSLPVPVH
jgi:hypothetical protein